MTAKFALDHEIPCPCATEADVDFMFLLSQAERVALSPAAMKGFLKGYQRKIPKNAVMEIWEFLFDDVGDEQWSFDTIAELLDHLRCRNKEDGRRGGQLEVLVDWHVSDIHCLRVVAGTLQLESRFTRLHNKIDDEELTEEPMDLTLLTIAKNFSLRRAVMTKMGRVVSLPCVSSAAHPELETLKGCATYEERTHGHLRGSTRAGGTR